MASIKVFALGGLDQKSNDLTRAVDKATEMFNLEYDTQSTLKKRNGFENITVTGDISFPLDPDVNGTLIDSIYFNARDEILLFVNNITAAGDVYKLTRNGSSWTSKYLQLVNAFGSKVSFCENQYAIYIAYKDGFGNPAAVLKYDGSSLYSPGLLAPWRSYLNKKIVNYGTDGIFNGTIPSTDGYYARIWAKYTDVNGNVINGPYVQSEIKLQTGFTVTNRNFSDLGGPALFLITTNASDFTLYTAHPTLTTASGKHNYNAGNKILILGNSKLITINSPAYITSVELEVESVTSTSVTFTTASLSGVTILFKAGTINVDRTCEYVIAISQSADTGYYVTDSGITNDLGLYISDPSVSPETFTINDTGFSTPGVLVPMEDVYDTTTLKLGPPHCSYIASFGSQIVYANVYSTLTLDNQLASLTSNDIIIYSDVNVGDGPENVSPLNIQKIGETWDGEITGLKRANDSLVIFKDKGIFSIDGVLISGQYALRKINTHAIGATCDRSILAMEEGLMFQGHNGIYFTNAINVQKMTYEIDPLFLSGTYLNTRSVGLRKKQKNIFYVPDIAVGTDKLVVMDYYYNQVYMWNNIDASLGLFADIKNVVYFLNNTGLFMFNDSYKDKIYNTTTHVYDNTAINSKYSTTWHHAGEPSLNKKWLSLRVFALTDAAYTTSINTVGDWDIHAPLTSNSLTFTTDDQTKFIMLDMKTKRSFRVTFSNNVVDENLPITGYELSYEVFNSVDKN